MNPVAACGKTVLAPVKLPEPATRGRAASQPGHFLLWLCLRRQSI